MSRASPEYSTGHAERATTRPLTHGWQSPIRGGTFSCAPDKRAPTGRTVTHRALRQDSSRPLRRRHQTQRQTSRQVSATDLTASWARLGAWNLRGPMAVPIPHQTQIPVDADTSVSRQGQRASSLHRGGSSSQPTCPRISACREGQRPGGPERREATTRSARALHGCVRM